MDRPNKGAVEFIAPHPRQLSPTAPFLKTRPEMTAAEFIASPPPRQVSPTVLFLKIWPEITAAEFIFSPPPR